MIPDGVSDPDSTSLMCFNYLLVMIPKYSPRFERIGPSLIPGFLVLGAGGVAEDKGDKLLKFSGV